MFPIRRQTRGGQRPGLCTGGRRRRLARVARAALSCLLAYGLAAHLILLGYAAAAVETAGARWPASITVSVQDGQESVPLAMILCRPGAEPEGNSEPDGVHARLCCGICALQAAAPGDRGGGYDLLAPQWSHARLPAPIREAPRALAPRLTPPARAPPLA